MVIVENLKNQLKKLINENQKNLNDITAVTLDQAWKILQLAIANIIQSIEINCPNLAGKDKKAIALELLSTFYDSVFLIINIPFVPVFIQPIIRSSIKKLLMLLAGATIDAMVTTFRNTGVFSSQSTKSDQ